MHAAHVSITGQDNVALAQRAAYQDNLQLDGGVHGKLLRAQEIDAGGADIAGYQGDWEVFNDPVDAVKL